MGKKRAKSSAGLPFPSATIIDLTDYRQRRSLPERHRIFYATENGRWQKTLDSFPFLEVEPITSLLSLKCGLLGRDPDLVLLESGISWVNPLDLIEVLGEALDVPIVMICDAAARKNASFLKQAFTTGLHDTLSTPLCKDELGETLEVLLKFRRQVSTNP